MQKRLALALIVLAVSLASWTRTDAQVLICASKTLGDQDQRRLSKAAKAVLPDDARLQAPSACRNRGSASAWIETEYQPNAEGAQEWWSLRCRRAWRDWSCEPPHLHRSGTMALVIDGRERTISLSFDGNTSLADARELASRAWSIYQDATTAPTACSATSANTENEHSAWIKARARYPLDPTASELEVSVTPNGNAMDVLLFSGSGLSLSFRRDPNDHSILPACWGEWVVVT